VTFRRFFVVIVWPSLASLLWLDTHGVLPMQRHFPCGSFAASCSAGARH